MFVLDRSSALDPATGASMIVVGVPLRSAVSLLCIRRLRPLKWRDRELRR